MALMAAKESQSEEQEARHRSRTCPRRGLRVPPRPQRTGSSRSGSGGRCSARCRSPHWSPVGKDRQRRLGAEAGGKSWTMSQKPGHLEENVIHERLSDASYVFVNIYFSEKGALCRRFREFSKFPMSRANVSLLGNVCIFGVSRGPAFPTQENICHSKKGGDVNKLPGKPHPNP